MSLDAENSVELIRYLKSTGRLDGDEHPTVSILRGGVSNRTVRLDRSSTHQSDWVIKQALSKLRVKEDWFSDPARIHREALGLRRLAELLPRDTVPAFFFEDVDEQLLAMEAVPTPHENWKSLLLAGSLDEILIDQAAMILSTLHQQSFVRRQELRVEFEDRSYFESLRLEPYYAFTASMVPEAKLFLQTLINDTRNTSLTLVHGDYSPKNMLVYRRKLVLLDHEVIHWGDPAFDLGFFITHLLSKAHFVVDRRSQFADAARQFWDKYFTGISDVPWRRTLEERAARHTIGCLLARVSGRSPLEYLNEVHRAHQQRAVIQLINSLPGALDDLVVQFIEGLA